MQLGLEHVSVCPAQLCSLHLCAPLPPKNGLVVPAWWKLGCPLHLLSQTEKVVRSQWTDISFRECISFPHRAMQLGRPQLYWPRSKNLGGNNRGLKNLRTAIEWNLWRSLKWCFRKLFYDRERYLSYIMKNGGHKIAQFQFCKKENVYVWPTRMLSGGIMHNWISV